MNIRHITKKIKKLPKYFWPLTPWTAVFAVLVLFVCAEASALVIQHSHTTVSKPPVVTTSKTPQVATNVTTSTSTPTQVTPSQSTSSTTQISGSTTNSNLPDQYGCIPQTSGYDSCVKAAKQNALTLSCDSQAKTAGDTYSATEDQAQAAYNTVMTEWNAVKDQPYQTHSPYDEYATDAKTKYNAIEKPAYATYVSTLSSITAQGCNVVKVYSDTSWAGY